MVQRQSEWDEGVTVRIVPTVDADGRIRLDGQFALKEITARSPIVGAEKLDLGRPLSHAVRTINPAVVLRVGEARLVPHLDGASVGTERVLLVVAEAAP
jgi:hypothetical protein